MNSCALRVTSQMWADLQAALDWDGRERAALMRCRLSGSAGDPVLLGESVVRPCAVDYVQRTAGGFELTKRFIDRELTKCVRENRHFVLAHIHPGGAHFSSIDHAAAVPAMRELEGQISGLTQAWITLSRDGDHVDGYYWDGDEDRMRPLDRICIPGPRRLTVSRPASSVRLCERGPEDVHARTVHVYGEAMVATLGCLRVAVVGASGTGSPLCELLVRMGVRDLLLVDHDRCEPHNLNRLQGFLPTDVGRPKVDGLADHLQRVAPEVRVTRIAGSAWEPEVQWQLPTADILFGCVDSDVRMALNRLAIAHSIPYIDLGSGVHEGHAGAQVYRITPGSGWCLRCLGGFPSLPTECIPDDEAERLRAQGYIPEAPELRQVNVYHVNMVAVGMAFDLLLEYLAGLPPDTSERSPIVCVRYDGRQRRIMALSAPPTKESGCPTCSEDGFLGVGYDAPLLLRALARVPASEPGDPDPPAPVADSVTPVLPLDIVGGA